MQVLLNGMHRVTLGSCTRHRSYHSNTVIGRSAHEIHRIIWFGSNWSSCVVRMIRKRPSKLIVFSLLPPRSIIHRDRNCVLLKQWGIGEGWKRRTGFMPFGKLIPHLSFSTPPSIAQPALHRAAFFSEMLEIYHMFKCDLVQWTKSLTASEKCQFHETVKLILFMKINFTDDEESLISRPCFIFKSDKLQLYQPLKQCDEYGKKWRITRRRLHCEDDF